MERWDRLDWDDYKLMGGFAANLAAIPAILYGGAYYAQNYAFQKSREWKAQRREERKRKLKAKQLNSRKQQDTKARSTVKWEKNKVIPLQIQNNAMDEEKMPALERVGADGKPLRYMRWKGRAIRNGRRGTLRKRISRIRRRGKRAFSSRKRRALSSGVRLIKRIANAVAVRAIREQKGQQSIKYTSNTSHSFDAAENQCKYYTSTDCSTSTLDSRLTNMIKTIDAGVIETTNAGQSYINRPLFVKIYSVYRIRNNTNIKTHLTVYWVRRKFAGNNLLSDVIDDYFDQENGGNYGGEASMHMTLDGCTTFRKDFKIMKRKHFVVEPGQTINIRNQTPRFTHWQSSYEIDSQLLYKKWARTVIFRVRGPVGHDSAAPASKGFLECSLDCIQTATTLVRPGGQWLLPKQHGFSSSTDTITGALEVAETDYDKDINYAE